MRPSAATWSVLAALILTGARAESVGFSLGDWRCGGGLLRGTRTAVSSWTYLLNQAEVITDYLRRSLWPYPLVFAYGEPRALALGGRAMGMISTGSVAVLPLAPQIGSRGIGHRHDSHYAGRD